METSNDFTTKSVKESDEWEIVFRIYFSLVTESSAQLHNYLFFSSVALSAKIIFVELRCAVAVVGSTIPSSFDVI